MTPDPDKERLRWIEKQTDPERDADKTTWRDEWVDRPDHYDR